ncbi:TPA: hypothetical protein HA251_05195 [Candidatus Woesearchaeota archaeon]|nr:hypothetical protein [Candidatus Woesearchaeota archaeon]
MANTTPRTAFITVLLLTIVCALAIGASPALAVFPGDPGYRGCVIATSDGALADVDCDKAPDPFDNCPFVANPDQVDRDANGIGDACDLVIDEIDIEPDMAMQGRSMLTTVGIFNARAYPMRNLIVKVEVPKLGLVNSEEISLINPGERTLRELVVRIPDCAPLKLTDVVVIVEYPYAPGQKEAFSQAIKVPVVPGETCAGGVIDDKTVVNIIEMQDIHPQTGALYPFTIHNNQPESKAYVLSVIGMDDWGASEINPGRVIVIPPGESREGAIQVWSYPGVSGKKSFTFSVQARDDTKQIMLLANIPQAARSPVSPGAQLFIGVIAFLGILLLIAAILLYIKHKGAVKIERKTKKK